MSLDLLYKISNAILPLPQAEWEALARCWTPVQYKRKTIMTAAGDVERSIYFVLSGAQRLFSLEGDKETTILFTYKGSFSGILDSFQLQRTTPYYLETLTESEFLRLSYADFYQLTEQYPLLQKWARLGTVDAMAGVLERYNELISYSAEKKFRTLLGRSPHVLQIIPHKYLASYLGIDPATFSKLLNTIKL
ncbi:cyclic nucleotide-binding domain-containing protein [Chitinophaga silvatica]|uniref:Cyclic nucleotide-binding domain-containing protein n=1 Tax=Chitinophaga silvatica TaxID=2282649 RepID=A0A3E1YAS5_9BACT|nr:cyclic nucleotide-binding domain-containing protein [Chitinophaga silvatica]RFS22820.1 cyclic nucleotide-binding domain-containing protein [Chitinophaga silvatica]